MVVDQFEELFTQSAPDDAARFMGALSSTHCHRRTGGGRPPRPHSRVRVVATLRADFDDRPLRHRGLGELLRIGTEVLTPMSPEDVEQAVNGPAERVGAICEPALVGELVAAVIDRPVAAAVHADRTVRATHGQLAHHALGDIMAGIEATWPVTEPAE